MRHDCLDPDIHDQLLSAPSLIVVSQWSTGLGGHCGVGLSESFEGPLRKADSRIQTYISCIHVIFNRYRYCYGTVKLLLLYVIVY